MKERKRIKTWPLFAVIWILMSAGIFIQLKISANLSLVPALIYLILVIGISVFVTHLLSNVLLPVLMLRKQLFRFALLAFGTCILLGWIYVGIDKLLIPNNKNLWVQWCSMMVSSLLIVGNICGIRFYFEHARIDEEHRLLKTAHLEAELKLLKEQLNPHFLFNVINSIHVLMQKDIKQASDVLLRFSDMLRHQLYDSGKAFITVQEDITYLKNYVSIEKMRKGNDLQVNVDWPDKPDYSKIAPCMLSPFIENAFKHVSNEYEPDNYVNIRLCIVNNTLCLEVENSVDREEQNLSSKKVGGIGLENVRKRLQLLYPDKHTLELGMREQSLFIAKLTLQLEEA
ncbi:sensor histidine kinase [Chitinophagaceae bacterium LWZ2-11]